MLVFDMFLHPRVRLLIAVSPYFLLSAYGCNHWNGPMFQNDLMTAGISYGPGVVSLFISVSHDRILGRSTQKIFHRKVVWVLL